MSSGLGDGDAHVEPAAAELAHEIRRRKREAGLSNSDLAAMVGYSRQYIGYAERPSRGFPSEPLITALDKALDAGGALVALHARAAAAREDRRAAATNVVIKAVDPANRTMSRQSQTGTTAAIAMPGAARGDMPFNADVQRREFLASVAVAAVGAAAPDSIARLLEGLNTGLPRHVGLAEVEAVEAAADAYMGLDLARSGNMAATLARSALNWSTELLKAEMSDPTRERLWSAVGLLADRLGWSIYDSGASGKAGRMLTFALDHAARGADRDLRAHVMLDLSTVMTDSGRPRDGVEILRAALGDERISAGERANLHAVCARHCASADQRDSGLRHAALAEESLGRNDGLRGPDWARQITYSPGHHDSALGLALFALDDVDRARQRLSSALAALDRGRTRTGLRCRIRLAILDLRDGEKAAGVAEGYRVIADAFGVTSTRIRADLKMLQAESVKYGASDLTSDLTPLLATA
ncbi:MAG: helix-turn-helix domain-containing protein [Pseudonocardia sp.]